MPDDARQMTPGEFSASELTIRDWFAGMAMQPYIDQWPNDTPDAATGEELLSHIDDFAERVAFLAYRHADAMIAQRTKSPDPDSPLWEPEHKET